MSVKEEQQQETVHRATTLKDWTPGKVYNLYAGEGVVPTMNVNPELGDMQCAIAFGEAYKGLITHSKPDFPIYFKVKGSKIIDENKVWFILKKLPQYERIYLCLESVTGRRVADIIERSNKILRKTKKANAPKGKQNVRTKKRA